jgi:hypothetical protein
MHSGTGLASTQGRRADGEITDDEQDVRPEFLLA